MIENVLSTYMFIYKNYEKKNYFSSMYNGKVMLNERVLSHNPFLHRTSIIEHEFRNLQITKFSSFGKV